MTEPTIAQKLRANLEWMRKNGKSREEMQAEIARAQEAIGRVNAAEQADAQKLSGGVKAASLLERAVGGATFGLGPMATDVLGAGIESALDPDKKFPEAFADIRGQRESRNAQLGGAGLLADLAGGLVTGGASLGAIKALANVGTAGKVGLALADGAVQGGVTSASEGLNDWSAAGLRRAAGRGAAGAAIGGTAGGVLGGVAGAVGRRAALARSAGETSDAGKVLRRNLQEATERDIQDALDRVDTFTRTGRGDEVMPVDALGVPGQNLARAAANIDSKAQETLAGAMRTRDADIVRRTRADLGEAAGFSPQQMDEFDNALLAQQKADAAENFGRAREEGAAFDALPTQIRTAPPITTAQSPAPSLRQALDDFRDRRAAAVARRDGTVMQQTAREGLERQSAIREGSPITGESRPLIDTDALPENYAEVVALVDRAAEHPIVQRTWGNLVKQNPSKFEGINPTSWEGQHKVYTEINKAIRAIEKQGDASAANESYNALLEAKTLLNESLAARSPSFRPANEAFADIAKGREAYKLGQQAAAQGRPTRARALQGKVREGKEALFRKGFVDDLAEQVGAGPSPVLDAAAASNSRIGQRAVRSDNAVRMIRDILGEDALGTLADRARQEGVFAQSSRAVQGNSTTARQVNGLAGLLGVTTDAAASFSMNPAWWATMLGRRLADREVKGLARLTARGNARTTAEALTRKGAANTQSVLQDLLNELRRQQRGAATGRAVGQRTRGAVSRASADN